MLPPTPCRRGRIPGSGRAIRMPASGQSWAGAVEVFPSGGPTGSDRDDSTLRPIRPLASLRPLSSQREHSTTRPPVLSRVRERQESRCDCSLRNAGLLERPPNAGVRSQLIPSRLRKGRWSINRFEPLHSSSDRSRRRLRLSSLRRSHSNVFCFAIFAIYFVLPRPRVANCMLATLGRGFFFGHSDF